MTDRYRFGSDSDQRGCSRTRSPARVRYTSEGYDVRIEDGHDRLAAELAATSSRR